MDYIIGLVTGFFNGLFGSGGGSILVPSLERFLKMEEHKAHSTAIAIILPLSIVSIFIYTRNVDIPIKVVLIICLGGLLGGFLGAKYLKKIPSKWLHKIFGIFMLIGAWRMIL